MNESKDVLSAVSKYLEGANPLTNRMKEEEIELKSRIAILENKESDALIRVETLDQKERGLLSSVDKLSFQIESLKGDIESLVRQHTADKTSIDIEEKELRHKIEILEQEKSGVEAQIVGVKSDYEALILAKGEELKTVVRELNEIRVLLKQTEHLESLSKGHFIREIQAILDKKNIKIDIMKELA